MIQFRRWMGSIGALMSFLAAPGFQAQAAELTPANVRMDFIIGGKHAPWYVALEKGFYAKRGLNVTVLASGGSADTVRTIGAGGADFGFADIGTMIVAKSRGTPVQAAAQFGYVEGVIKGIKDLPGKSWAISPGQAQWYLMPAYCRINKIDFKAIKVQETAAPIQPAVLATKKADFIIMFRASNDEVAELAASKVGVKLNRVFMKDTGLDIYGTSLIVKDEDVKKRPEFVRAREIKVILLGFHFALALCDAADGLLARRGQWLDCGFVLDGVGLGRWRRVVPQIRFALECHADRVKDPYAVSPAWSVSLEHLFAGAGLDEGTVRSLLVIELEVPGRIERASRPDGQCSVFPWFPRADKLVPEIRKHLVPIRLVVAHREPP